jgi:hypothetical protein
MKIVGNNIDNSNYDLIIIVCCYYVHVGKIIEIMNKHLEKEGLKFIGVVVDNKEQGQNISLHKDWSVINGSNEINEFSAYQEGISHARTLGVNMKTPMMIINDSLFTKHSYGYLLKEFIKNKTILKNFEEPSMIGMKSYYSSICLTNPWSSTISFIPSYIFLINYKALELFETLPDCALKDGIMFNDKKYFGKGLKLQFLSLITYHSIKANERSTKKISNMINDDLGILKKARCIYFEHRLTGLIGENGILFYLNDGWRKEFKFKIFEFLALVVNRLKFKSN